MNPINLPTAAAWIIFAYLIGSIPFSLLLVRWTKGIDLRRVGSGNIGATNARRAAGTGWGIVALIGDALKGAVPAALVLYWGKTHPQILPEGWAAVAALAAVAGHMFPAFFKFRPSGKGVATTIGGWLVLSPPAVGIMLAVLLVFVALFRRMSLGSIAGVIALPPAVWVFTRSPVGLISTIIVMVLVLLRHKENIARLRQGREPKV